MTWRKSPEELIATFTRALPTDPKAEQRTMFGYPCCFVGGNMFTGLHQETMIVRLPPDARAELLGLPGAALFEPMPGRTMKEYVVVPASIRSDPRRLRAWVARAFAYAAALPAKKRRAEPKARTAASKTSARARRRR